MILQSDPLGKCVVQLGGEAGVFPADPKTDPGGRGKGVSLDMIDGEYIILEPVTALGRLVGGIAFMVNTQQQIFEIL